MIVDSHCHLDRLDFDKLDLDLDQVLDNARAMFAKGDGSHQFSKTLQEHNRAVKQYQLN